MVKKSLFYTLLLCLLISCRQESKIEKEIAELPISFEVNRFDREFAQAKPEDLTELQEKYPLLFPAQYSDQEWIDIMKDSIQLELNSEVYKKFPEFDQEEEELYALFQHLKYYYSDFEAPRVITVTSEVDYESSVILADSLLLISLDTYLGEDHHFYTGIQRYFSKNFTPDQILPDVALEYAEHFIPKPEERSFLDYMIYYGKQLYFKKHMLPKISDARILGYTEDELKWAESNERQIWGYIVEEDILYDTDSDLRRRLFDIGPYTKFGLGLDNESPPQLGQYIGWQIVEFFAERNKDVSLPELMNMNNRTLFEQSNYKPKQN